MSAHSARPAIVFIHGALNDHSVWSAQVDALRRHGHQVLAPDLPGHGGTPGPALAGCWPGWMRPG
jgi:pimeloyl-ACP methyl ester carboxylesterase